MVALLFSILYTIIYCIMYLVFLNSFADKHYYKKQYVPNILTLLWIALVSVESWVLDYNLYLKFLFLFLINFIFIRLLFNISVYKIIILITVYQGIYLGVDYLMLTISEKINPNLTLDIINNSKIVFVIGGLGLLFEIIIIVIVSNILNKDKTKNLRFEEWIIFGTISLFDAFMCIEMIINYDYNKGAKDSDFLTFISLGMLVINLLVFFMIQGISARENKIITDRLLLEQSKNIKVMYDETYTSYKSQLEREHEYKNQLLTLRILLEKERYSELEKYLDEFDEEISHNVDIINTNNPVIDAVLNTKYSKAQSKDILMIIKINDLSDIPISDGDMVIILANMLDNAIEATEKLEENRLIKIKIIKEKNKLLISAINTYKDRIKREGDKFLTSKKHSTIHGMGISNIRAVVKKYGGECTINVSDNEFKMTNIIPL